jgi:hypothetical protein
VSIIELPMVPTLIFNLGVTTTTFCSSLANGGESVSGNGTTWSGGTDPSISTCGPWPTFNLVMEFFWNLQQNYQRIQIEKIPSF